MTRKEKAMYRRWAYMAVAILAAVILLHRPTCNFLDDKGIYYVRSFSMTQKEFVVTQTDLKTDASNISATMSLKGLYYCIMAMIGGVCLCFLCFFSNRWRIILAVITAFIAGSYYIILVYYIYKMSDVHYATVYPNLTALLPAVVCQMMLLVRKNIFDQIAYAEDHNP